MAAKHWFPDFREPKDLDYITEEPFMSREVQHYWIPSFEYILNTNVDTTYVDANYLYTIKVSHAAWNIHHDKTLKDIIFFQHKGCELNIELYKALVKDWTVVHGKKHVNLNKPNEYFFVDKVTRKYNHDDLHRKLAFYEAPLHEKIRHNPFIALPNEELFNKLSKEDQLKCALEEIYVIATERFLDKYPLKIAKVKAMKQLITTMTKGWFNLFLILNFETLLKSDNNHWTEKLKELT